METNQYNEYIRFITLFLEKHHFKELESIILFGSNIKYDRIHNSSTDVDLIIIVHDSCTNICINRIKQELQAIENKFCFNYWKNEISFFKGLQNATGMFVNSFVCKYSDFKNRDFTKVFGINLLMGLLAPKNSVWWSISKQYQIIWGSDLVKLWDTTLTIKKNDLLKSFIMNWLLVTSALIFYPFYKEITKFSMEAVKWSLFTWRNYYMFPVFTINKICGKFLQKSTINERRTLRCLLEYRNNKKVNNFFPLLAWLFVLKLHVSLLGEI